MSGIDNKDIRVLLVEDNPGDRDLIAEYLEFVGTSFAVDAVATLQDAVVRLSQGNFDVVLLDLGLPDSVGEETVNVLVERYPLFPVIVLTGHDDDLLAKGAIKSGAQDYLIKGKASPQMIEKAILYAIDRKGVDNEISAIYDNAPMLMLLVDEDKKVRRLNKAVTAFGKRAEKKLLGLRGGEALGCIHAMEDPEGCGASPYCQNCLVQNLVNQTLATGEPARQVEVDLCLQSAGKTRNVSFSVSTSRIFMENRPRVLVTLQDVSERKQAEDRLRKQQEKYRLLFDTMTQGVMYHDAHGKIFAINPMVSGILGQPENEILGKSPESVFADAFCEDGSLFSPGDFPANVALATGKPVHDVILGFSNPKKDQPMWIKLDSVPLFLPDSTAPYQVHSVFEDITSKKLAEEQLKNALEETRKRASETQELLDASRAILQCATFKQAARKIFDACCRVVGGQSGYVALLNEAGDENEVLFLEAGGLPCTVDPKLPMPIRGLRAEAYQANQVVYDNDFMNGKWAEYMPFGHVVLHNVLFAPLAIDGRVAGVMGVANKPTDFDDDDARIAGAFGNIAAIALRRTRAEEALQKSEKALAEAQKVSRVGNWHYDLIRQETTLSREMFSIFGLDPAQSLPTSEEHKKNVHPKDWPLLEQAYDDAVTQGTPFDLEFRSQQKKDRVMWLQAIGKARKNAKGQIVELFGTVQDITERKNAEQERHKLQDQLVISQKVESVGRLAGGVAHDFNNMLSVILGYTEMAMDKLDGQTTALDDLKEVHDAATRSADLTRQLLAFARKQPISPRILALNDTVAGMLKMLQRLISENIELVFKPGPDLWDIHVDPSQIDQILANLSVNARDAITGVGNLTIETENMAFDATYCSTHAGFSPGEYVLLAISDTGAGMDKEVQQHLFEPFFTTKELGKGTGLGLATVYGIVKQNNGFINVYSEPDHGTAIKIYFPRARVEEKETIQKTSTDPTAGTETILMAEDEESILRLGKAILTRYGYHVLAAQSPADALEIARTHPGPIQLLVTDVVMPEMNGRELQEKIKQIRPDIKVLFMSGYTANVIVHHGVLDEGVNYLQKPFSVKTLTDRVRDVLDGK